MSRNSPRFLLIALAMSALPAYGQVCILGPRPSAYRANLDQSATASATEITIRVGEAFRTTCTPKCPTVGLFSNSTARYAMVFTSPGAVKIVYAPTFWTAVSTRYGDDGLIGLTAHEYGHVIDSVSIGTWMLVDWSPELRADAWAGCSLANLKLNSRSLEQALAAMARYASTSQPNWSTRVTALRAGYARCGAAGDFDKSAATVRSTTKKR